MSNLIACCGLNCEVCDARIATINNDDNLREATAKKWQEMYNSKHLTAESIHCTGCREEGIKFAHCNKCEIRKCVANKGYKTCGDCNEMEGCKIVEFVHKAIPEAIENLRKVS